MTPPSLSSTRGKKNSSFMILSYLIFSFLFFSFLLSPSKFLCLPCSFLKQPFSLFFLHNWFLFFWLLFILIEIIYQIWFFFSISSCLIFFSSIIYGFHSFNCYFLVSYYYLDFFIFQFNPSLFYFIYFLYQI